MAITAEDINNQSFSIDRKGYNVDEVDVFLEHVASEIDALNQQVDDLEDQVASEGTAAATAVATEQADIDYSEAAAAVDNSEYEAIIAEKDAIIADLTQQLEDKKANDNAISQALIIAQRSADEIIERANVQASDTIQDARDEATRILNRANNDKQAVVESIRKLEDDREDTREGYQDILRDFIADATRKLADLGAPTASKVDTDDAGLVGDVYVDQVEGQVVLDDAVDENLAADYTTPQTTETIAAAVEPVASTYEKDLSGFGDPDEFEFEEID